ncbi:glucosaminidase domain-containing protein [Candidatus Microgenomates bacterium]|nr:glucosaminidase domain-containing protein [Candidatus Microgenomates bacterium]
MTKFLLNLLVILGLTIFLTSPIQAQTTLADSKRASLADSKRASFITSGFSAELISVKPVKKADKRVQQLRLFLAHYNSPLEDFAPAFIESADRNGVDWKLVPAITGVESTFGKAIPAKSYNAYGWANGEYYFKNWGESIEIVNKTLKEKYIDRGANTVEKIAPIYAPPSRTWAGKVNFFMRKIESFDKIQEPQSLALSL